MDSIPEKPAVWGVYGTAIPLYNFNITSLVVLWFMFALRGYVRVKMVKVWSATDWHMLVTMVLYTWLCISVNMAIYDGFGRDMTSLPPNQLATAFKQYYFAEFAYVASVLFIKLSLACFYLPLTNLRWQIYTVYAIIVINSLYTTGYLCIIVFQCHPIDHFWNQFTGATNGRCLSSTVIMNLSYAHNTMEIISDWILSALPIWLLSLTQLTRRTKLAVGLCLSLGAFASIASIIRISQLNSFTSSMNYTVTSIPIILWSVIENAVGIFAANLATLRILLSVVLERLGLSSSRGASTNGPSAGGVTKDTGRGRGRHHHRQHRASAAATTTTKGGYVVQSEGHDLRERDPSECGSYKSTERIVSGKTGLTGQHVTTIVSKRDPYGDDDGGFGDGDGVPLRGISKNTEVTVTSQYREEP